MTRQKKTRSAGPLAPTQKPRVKKSIRENLDDKRKKKPKGLKPGSRNSQEQNDNQQHQQKQQQDARHGSKRPISLTPQPEVNTQNLKPQVILKKNPVKPIDPEQELLAIEADERLLALLEQVDNDEILKGKDAKYFNAKTARHQELMELLGYENDDDDDYDGAGDDEELPEDDERSLLDQWQDDDKD